MSIFSVNLTLAIQLEKALDDGGIIGGNFIEISLNLEKGWNLVNGLVSTKWITGGIEPSSIKAIYGFNPRDKGLVRFYPKPEKEKISPLPIDYMAAYTAFWVYSDKAGTINYVTLGPAPKKRELFAGWNLLGLSPDLIESPENPDLRFEDIKGTCNVERAHYFFNGNWVLFNLPEMDSTLLRRGMAIKVSNNCTFGQLIYQVPQLPN